MPKYERTVSIERKGENEFEVVTAEKGVSLLSVFSGTLRQCRKVAHGFWAVGYHKTGRYLVKMPKFNLGTSHDPIALPPQGGMGKVQGGP